MITNEIDENVLAQLKVKILRLEKENAKTQAKTYKEMVDTIYSDIITVVSKKKK